MLRAEHRYGVQRATCARGSAAAAGVVRGYMTTGLSHYCFAASGARNWGKINNYDCYPVLHHYSDFIPQR